MRQLCYTSDNDLLKRSSKILRCAQDDKQSNIIKCNHSDNEILYPHLLKGSLAVTLNMKDSLRL